MPKLVFISDTHCQLAKVDVPDGDYLFHAGDLTYRGTIPETQSEIKELALLRQRFKGVYFTPGNHDWLFYMEQRGLARQMLDDAGVTLLEDREVEVEGLRVYGSPWVPQFFDWAFMLPRRSEDLALRWAAIPEGLDLLVTHGPPYGVLDETPDGVLAGCELLADRLRSMDKPPKFHAFGHIHSGWGYDRRPGARTISLNAAICNSYYEPDNRPLEVEIT